MVATDGSRTADGALRVAHALAARAGAEVELVSIWEAAPAAATRGRSAADDDASRQQAVEELVRRVHRQCVAVASHDEHWPIRVESGAVIESIARAATERDADLVLVGTGAADGLGLRVADAVARRLTGRARVPVVGVPGDAAELSDCELLLPTDAGIDTSYEALVGGAEPDR